MGKTERGSKKQDIQAVTAKKMEEIERKKVEKLVYLIAEIIVNASFRDHEKKSN
jgi:hypothetical protein